MKKKTTWTPDQQQVIDLRGSSMLVSAAAGSGKTAVLTARILERVCDPVSPVDIDRILVVTFTNAAAQEMRQRIRDALVARLEEAPGNEHLHAQITLMGHAKISTIHSFCVDVLRSGFDRIGLDPSFRVADEGELKLMRYDAVSQVLEEAYAKADPDFLRFCECFAPGRDDSALGELVLSFYGQSDGNPRPGVWRRQCMERLSEPPMQAQWLQEMVLRRKRELAALYLKARQALKLAAGPAGPWMYEDTIRADLAILETLESCGDYEAFYEAAGEVDFQKLSGKKDENVSPEKREQVKALRGEVKDGIRRILDDFADSPEALAQQQSDCAALAQTLCGLTDRFEAVYEQMRRDKNVLSFSDMEHLALQILTEEDGSPSKLAQEYAQSFEEIMIDEYQDSNLVQEMILNAVCREGEFGKNLFMVGDVKQSIYRFRLARPELFLEKYQTYRQVLKEQDQPGCARIDLKKNFRSRPQVLHFCNLIFEKIMHRELGGVEYDDAAALYPGAVYPEADDPELMKPEVLLLGTMQPGGHLQAGADADEEEEEEEELTKQAAEARLIARKIRSLYGQALVTDAETGQLRPAAYGDMAVLLRSPSAWIDTLLEIFREEGIPALSAGAAGYFAAQEVRTVLNLLSILDNPRQDIPLAAVLRSPIGGFSNAQLARIRLAAPKGGLYDACLAFRAAVPAAEADTEIFGRLEAFLEMIRGLRDLASCTPMQELLQICLDRTGYESIVLAMPDGKRRRENLSMLMEKATDFEAGSFRGLFHFIRYIENLQKYEIDYGEAVSGGDDAVRILSIHKSKGLEYPIVILGGLGKHFNLQDTKGSVLVHQDLGIGMDLVDPVLRTRRKTLCKRAVAERIREDSLGEELRVLYVAMTRAREKLILTGFCKDPGDAVEKWKMQAEAGTDRPGGNSLFQARCYLDWIMPALLMEQTGAYSLQIAGSEDIRAGEGAGAAQPAERFVIPHPQPGRIYDPQAHAYLEEICTARYAYENAAQVPGKVSVSLLKHLHMDEVEAEMKELFPQEDAEEETAGAGSGTGQTEKAEKAPASGGEGGAQILSGAERGTLYHRVLELLDFSQPADENFVQTQLETLIRCGKIRKDVMQVLSVRKLQRFVCSDLGKRMHEAATNGRLHRETPFVLGVDASQVNSQWDGRETVLVQGIIDVWFEEEDEIILLDYKTDRVEEGFLQYLAEKYRVQMEYYGRALQQLTGKRVREAWIYSFSAGQAVLL